MILLQASVTGKTACGSIHIVNVGGDAENGVYDAECYDPAGKLVWREDGVNHRRENSWDALVYFVLAKHFGER